MLIDESFVSQRQQVDRLVHIIHQRNPIILPSILNPGPLLTNNADPQAYTGRASAEAFGLLLQCARCLVRVPGARETLEEHFGKILPMSFESTDCPDPEYHIEPIIMAA